MQRFCSSPDGVMVCGNADGREVYAVTHDIIPDKGWVMQFKVTTGPKPTHRQYRHIFVSCEILSSKSVDINLLWQNNHFIICVLV